MASANPLAYALALAASFIMIAVQAGSVAVPAVSVAVPGSTLGSVAIPGSTLGSVAVPGCTLGNVPGRGAAGSGLGGDTVSGGRRVTEDGANGEAKAGANGNGGVASPLVTSSCMHTPHSPMDQRTCE